LLGKVAILHFLRSIRSEWLYGNLAAKALNRLIPEVNLRSFAQSAKVLSTVQDSRTRGLSSY